METMMLPLQPPRFEFYDPHSPIYTSPRFLPPAKIVKSKVSDAIISHGAYLEECTVENAIVGLRARIGKKTVIRVRESGEPAAALHCITIVTSTSFDITQATPREPIDIRL